MTRVAVTPRSLRQTPGAHLDRLHAEVDVRFPDLDRPLDEDEMVELVRDCAGLIVGVDPVTPRVLEAGPLRVVVKYGSGMDNIDVEAARSLGVQVSSTPGTNARSVAELAIALLLTLARNVALHDRGVRAGSWRRFTGVELAGKQLGIVGYGAIGREVARIARGLDMNVVAHDPLVEEADVDLVPLDELYAASDVVSLHLPLTDETRGLVGARELAVMKPTAFLINTARGGLVDESALADALRSGRLAGAALDGFEVEPLGDSPLRQLENVVFSPHAGASTYDAVLRTAAQAVDQLLADL
ncbi:MAG TPA: phosphoglycerate dehydrogenase [Gaiellaceae bacterium]|nr:phosphoglycerate dehydrogenase [Gaiellaceae bacterium]